MMLELEGGAQGLGTLKVLFICVISPQGIFITKTAELEISVAIYILQSL